MGNKENKNKKHNKKSSLKRARESARRMRECKRRKLLLSKSLKTDAQTILSSEQHESPVHITSLDISPNSNGGSVGTADSANDSTGMSTEIAPEVLTAVSTEFSTTVGAVSSEILIEVEPRPIAMIETKKEVQEQVQERQERQEREDVECRACLQRFAYEAGLLDMFQAWEPPWNGMGESIAQDFSRIANIEITPTDSCSKLICQFCHQRLLDACTFVVNVRINDRLLRQRAENPHEYTWPKPIQIDKNINSNVFNPAMDVEIKQEVLSEDETYANCEDAFKDGDVTESTENVFSNVEIKVEPEEIIKPSPYHIVVNEPSTSTNKNSKRKSKVSEMNNYKLNLAVKDVLAGNCAREIAKTYGINYLALCKQVKEIKTATEAVPENQQKLVLSDVQESELVDYLVIARKLCHGLTPSIVRQFAYQYANMTIKWFSPTHAPTWVNKAASYDWFYNFMHRHKELTMRGPDKSRLPHDNKNVAIFFDNLKSLLDLHNFSPMQIWNVDEVGMAPDVNTSVPKQAAKLSIDDAALVCSAINAAGGYLPPFIIFPAMESNGSGKPTERAGSMTGANFLIFLDLFVKHARCSEDNPNLIILDTHESHITIESIKFCRDNGILLLTIPPYTLQKLQPLNPIFGQLKSCYRKACQDWKHNFEGVVMTPQVSANCLNNAYSIVMARGNIQKSFASVGICPFNPGILTENCSNFDIEIQNVKSLAQNDRTIEEYALLSIKDEFTSSAVTFIGNDIVTYSNTFINDKET